MEKEKKYLVQAILIDNTGNETIESVVDSIKTDDIRSTAEFLMRRHKNNPHYLYKAINIETQEVELHQTMNPFCYW